MTLREFFKKFDSELLPNLYTITINHKLSFQQDLLYSKIVSKQQIKINRNEHQFNVTGGIENDFVLLQT